MAGKDRVKGVKRYKHPVSGIWYCYHRKSGTRIEAEWRSAEFYQQVAALDASAKAAEPAPGSLGLLIDAYRKSPAWAPLAPKTRLGYDGAFRALQDLWDLPITKLTRRAIFRLRDEKVFPKRGRWMANYIVVVLGLLLDYAADRELIDANPLTKKVKRIRAPKGHVARNRPWYGQECTVVIERAPPHLKLPLALAMFAGFRKEDVLNMTQGVIKDGMITVRTSKRGVDVTIPIHAALREALDAHEAALDVRNKPRNEVQLCLNSFGEKWTESGFNSSWATFRDGLLAEGKVAKGLTFHGLRHTLGTRLKEAGATAEQRKDILGQKSVAMAEHYAEGAELDEKTKGLVLSLDVRRKK